MTAKRKKITAAALITLCVLPAALLLFRLPSQAEPRQVAAAKASQGGGNRALSPAARTADEGAAETSRSGIRTPVPADPSRAASGNDPDPPGAAVPAADVATGLVAAPAATMWSAKIGVVDMNRVFREYHKTALMERKMNEDQSKAKKEMDARSGEYRKLTARLAEIDKTLKDRLVNEALKQQKYREGQALMEEANRMGREIQEFAGRRERQLKDTADRLKRGLLKEILPQVVETSKRGNFDFVFDRTALGISGTPLLPFSRAAADISGEVIADLNRNAPAAGTAHSAPAPAAEDSPPKAATSAASESVTAAAEAAPSGQ